MSSVTQRINEITQPRGGYINPSQFKVYKLPEDINKFTSMSVANGSENISAAVVGMVVDYMTRLLMSGNRRQAFNISLQGAVIAEKMFNQYGAVKEAEMLLSGIQGTDTKSIINACKLVVYDSWLRNPAEALKQRLLARKAPDAVTIQNIKFMIKRSIRFWDRYGPIVSDCFTFEPYGYTSTVDSGDGDYLTADTLWDFKVSRNELTKEHTLQLLMYWVMGQHSGQEIYKHIDKIGIFNPRLNKVYLLPVAEIPKETIEEVERKVICY